MRAFWAWVRAGAVMVAILTASVAIPAGLAVFEPTVLLAVRLAVPAALLVFACLLVVAALGIAKKNDSLLKRAFTTPTKIRRYLFALVLIVLAVLIAVAAISVAVDQL